jgi:hypothetical protein
MTRASLLVAFLFALAVRLAPAQVPAAPACDPVRDPLSASLKQAYDSAVRDLARVADLAPDGVYAFRPAADARSFGAQIAHVVDVMRMLCSLAAGSRSPSGESVEATWKTKADVTAALERARHYCDGVYGLMTDGRALQPVEAGPAVVRARLLIDNVSHIRQHYGNLRTYLRLNGITPPPAERLPTLRKPTA